MKYEIGASMPRKSKHGCKLARRESHRVIKQEARRGRGTAVRRAIAWEMRHADV